MKALVTGATGFIGAHVCAELLTRGIGVRAVTRSASRRGRLSGLLSDIEWVEADVLTATDDVVRRTAEGIDVAVLAAWSVVPGEYLLSPENERHRDATLRWTAALIRAGCEGVTGLGTCFEYRLDPHPLRENSPVEPLTPYASGKLAACVGGAALAVESGIPFAWARLFYVYGPEEDPRRLVPGVALKLIRGERAAVTEGRQVRDFLHVADVAAALVSIALARVSGPVNVGSGIPVRVRDIVTTVAALVGGSRLVDFGARKSNLTDPPFVCADNRRLVQLTGWRPKFDLASGLEQTVRWWKARA